MIPTIDQFGRPNFDLWFMTLAFVVSQRSLDPNTKHGTVVVDNSNAILTVGYNSPPRGCVDEAVPLTSPEKYDWMSHSEINAIANAAKTGTAINNSTFYVTGPPCVVCFRSILNSGAKRLVYGPIKAARFMDGKSEDEIVKERMLNEGISYGLEKRDFSLEVFDDIESIGDLLESTCKYMNDKVASQQ